MKKSQSVAVPAKKTKLAYVDSMVKPPRNVIKKQVHSFVQILSHIHKNTLVGEIYIKNYVLFSGRINTEQNES